MGGRATGAQPAWPPDGEGELHKIPFFERGTERTNTKAFARKSRLIRIDA